ncbi:MAG: sensor domain-containing diguanylate cyclase [Desulfobacterales bacterium]|nr:sensor domain-containing diguanylate cyclase [Desulfobacterales bacterium]
MVNVGIVILDKDCNVFKWNRWLETRSKISADKIIGEPIFNYFPELNKSWFHRNFKSVINFGNFSFFSQKLHKYFFPFKASNTLGSKFEFMQQSCTMGPLRDEHNNIAYTYIMIQDVTEIAAYEQRLIDLNTKDSLTGIFNRRYLEKTLEGEFARHQRYSRPFSVVMMDIDFFKKINDTHGHQCGDYVLQAFVESISTNIRTVDIVARYGGEEFCCLLPETPLDAAVIMAENLRNIIEKSIYHYNDIDIRFTISQGVSELSDQVESAQDLIKKADSALYEAKASGRNRVCSC